MIEVLKVDKFFQFHVFKLLDIPNEVPKSPTIKKLKVGHSIVRISLEEGEKKDAITPMANSTNKKGLGRNYAIPKSHNKDVKQ